MLRRLRHDLEVGHRLGALPDRGADAVGAGVAAADDDDVLAGREDRLGRAGGLAAVAAGFFWGGIYWGKGGLFNAAPGPGERGPPRAPPAPPPRPSPPPPLFPPH